MKRALVITEEDFIDYRTKWYEDKEEIALRVASELIAWRDFPDFETEVTIVIEEKVDSIEFTKCPHCRDGNLRESKTTYGYDYSCDRCARAWEIENDGTWQAHFDAAKMRYSHDAVVDIQRHKENTKNL